MKVFSDIKNILCCRASRNCIAGVSAVIVMVMLMSVMIIRRNDVRVYVDGALTAHFETLADDTGIWLKKAGVTVYEGDTLRTENNNIYIDRAVYVTVIADGQQVSYKTAKGTVKDVLAAGDITIGDADIVSPARYNNVTENVTITVERVSTATITETETIKYETKKVKDSSMYEGQTEVKTKGVNGKTEHTYNVTYIDGKETSRELVSSKVVTEPVTEVIKVGTKIKSSFKASANAPKNYKAVYTMRGSAYTYGNDGGNYTCLGKPTSRGTVAVDPNVIPLGTRLYIESEDGKYIYGEAVAGDTGGAIKGYKIDLFVESQAECRAFGRRNVIVYILD